MMHINFRIEFISEMAPKRFGCIYAAVLPARAAKTDHQVSEPAADIILDGNIHEVIHAVEKFRHLGLLFQKVFDGFVASCLNLELFKAPRIQNRAAIKYKSAAIAESISRDI